MVDYFTIPPSFVAVYLNRNWLGEQSQFAWFTLNCSRWITYILLNAFLKNATSSWILSSFFYYSDQWNIAYINITNWKAWNFNCGNLLISLSNDFHNFLNLKIKFSIFSIILTYIFHFDVFKQQFIIYFLQLRFAFFSCPAIDDNPRCTAIP